MFVNREVVTVSCGAPILTSQRPTLPLGGSSVSMSNLYQSMTGKSVLFRGKRARVLGYLGSGKFDVLGADDSVYVVHRDRLVFL